MRSVLFLAATVLTCSLGFNKAQAQTALAFASNAEYATAGSSETPTASKNSEKMVLTGKITNAAGVLPGAVVIITATKQMAVTNAEGEFEFVVPANAGPLDARVTYGGYADEKMVLNAANAESTVSLTNAHVVVVARSQRLEKYLKTARKQIKHELRQLHK
ncbi:carboxypeptidase-like regulatory domain-containing protein [Hymenobacter sp. DH14]|uniref:Carboxypeptidase-like regulatory domain-containing protein n=1 Tax=Hymenobacter cyanobacteriorum TaxID=2926463 RepID=A0A9X1VID4_9BACT|nr:carboxypeptidase regulatory-like domain-containing protein [Hymenobacter cyanobacteriorum]MCI1186926.1 carboxypeptidase-like regulatory domain-containing protein [Hymenobacter cyanobacteriorum]